MKYGNIQKDNYYLEIKHNDKDDFSQCLIANGIYIRNGGTPINYVINKIVPIIREKLSKKFPSIKNGDIKNKLKIFLSIRFFPALEFTSQEKIEVSNSQKSIGEFLKNMDFNKIVRQILKDEDIMLSITEYFRLKEQAKQNAELKKLSKKVKKIKMEKFYPAIKENKNIFILEGECLEENTKIIMPDFSNKKIKDIEIGEKVLTHDFKEAKVLNKTKLLKKTLKIKTKSSEIICTENHRFFVYDTKDKKFVNVEAIELKKNINRYKFVKSKINKNTNILKVVKIDFENNFMLLDNNYRIDFTLNDYFGTITEGKILRKYVKDLKVNDYILFFKDD